MALEERPRAGLMMRRLCLRPTWVSSFFRPRRATPGGDHPVRREALRDMPLVPARRERGILNGSREQPPGLDLGLAGAPRRSTPTAKGTARVIVGRATDGAGACVGSGQLEGDRSRRAGGLASLFGRRSVLCQWPLEGGFEPLAKAFAAKVPHSRNAVARFEGASGEADSLSIPKNTMGSFPRPQALVGGLAAGEVRTLTLGEWAFAMLWARALGSTLDSRSRGVGQ